MPKIRVYESGRYGRPQPSQTEQKRDPKTADFRSQSCLRATWTTILPASSLGHGVLSLFRPEVPLYCPGMVTTGTLSDLPIASLGI